MEPYNNEFDVEFFRNTDTPLTIALDVRLIYIISGKLRLTVGNEISVLSSEDFIIVNAGVYYAVKCELDCIYTMFKMDYQMITRQMNSPCVYFLCDSIKRIFDDTRYVELDRVLKNLLEEHLTMPSSDSFKKKRLWYTLLERLTTDFIILTPFALDRMTVDARMNYVIQYICANYSQPLHQEDIADMVYLSPSTFSRWFKKRFGMNYTEFIRDVRMTHAADELITTTKSITEIAMSQGFTDVSGFTKLFKQHFSLSPASYRKKNTRQISDSRDSKILLKKIQEMEFSSADNLKQSNSNREIFLNVKSGKTWHNPWGIILNAGPAHLLLLARMQDQIRHLKEPLSMKYIRISNLFSREMRLKTGHEQSRENFDYLDNVMDFILSCELTPMIVLCERALGALKSVDQMIYEEIQENVFGSCEEMNAVISGVFRHFVRRYGISEVRKWLVECWTDDCSNQIMGINAPCEDVFQGIYDRIKNIVPGIAIGGFGLDLSVSADFFADLLTKVIKKGCLPDFVTIYVYPYDRGKNRLQDSDYTRNSIMLCKNILNNMELKNAQVIVSEWNLSLSMRNFYNDSCAKAALMLRHMAGTLDSSCIIAYSMASDLCMNYFDGSGILHGASGLCSKDGLLKPVFYAILFISKFRGRLIAAEQNYIAAIRESGEIDILLFNSVMPGYRYFMKKEYDISAKDLEVYFNDEEALELRIELKDLPGGIYMKKYHILNSENGSLMDNWLAMGDVGYSTVNIMDYLRCITRPKIYFEKITTRDGLLFLTERLKSNEMRYIHLYKLDSWSDI